MNGTWQSFGLSGPTPARWSPGLILSRRGRAALLLSRLRTPFDARGGGWYPLVLGLAAGALLWPASARAQQDTTWRSLDTARVNDVRHEATKPPDFLFRAPRFSLDLRAGMNLPRAGGDFFATNMQELTLSRSSFVGLTGGADVGFRLTKRLDALLGVAYAHASHPSEDRVFVDENNAPIEQRTTFSQLPITAGLRAYLFPRGRQIGHFVWVPRRVDPYVGVAGGMMHYSFEQHGDFVAYQDSTIFTGSYEASGWAPVAQVLGGVDVGLGRHTALKLEARYAWSSGGLGDQFVGFRDGLDLSGLQTTVGLSWRY